MRDDVDTLNRTENSFGDNFQRDRDFIIYVRERYLNMIECIRQCCRRHRSNNTDDANASVEF